MCFKKKTEDLNLTMFNMIAGLNYINKVSCEYKCEFDGRKCNSDQWSNNHKCLCECRKCHVCVKDHI